MSESDEHEIEGYTTEELDKKFENSFQCGYCGDYFDSAEERDDHVFQVHADLVERDLAEIEKLSVKPETKEVLADYIDRRKKEILEEASTHDPRKFSNIEKDPSILDKEVRDQIWLEALKAKRESTFDALMMQMTYPDPFGKCPQDCVKVVVNGVLRCIKREVYQTWKKSTYPEPPTSEKSSEKLSAELSIAIFKKWIESKRTGNRSD